jgi:hypothetical protein
MSYASIISGAAKQAQGILAPMVDPDASGVFTLAGTAYTGVIPAPESTMVPTQTGFEYRAVLTIDALKTQFSSVPNPATRPLLTARGATWSLIAVTPADAHYRLTCVPGTA